MHTLVAALIFLGLFVVACLAIAVVFNVMAWTFRPSGAPHPGEAGSPANPYPIPNVTPVPPHAAGKTGQDPRRAHRP